MAALFLCCNNPFLHVGASEATRKAVHSRTYWPPVAFMYDDVPCCAVVPTIYLVDFSTTRIMAAATVKYLVSGETAIRNKWLEIGKLNLV
jgi:hypothetical protein